MKKYFNVIILILWMLFIFIMSNSSSVQSSNQSGLITTFINEILKIENIEILEIIIRKLAHLFEYTILGILMINCLKDYKINKYLILSIILCVIYSCTDEIHQIFIPGRNGNLKDVLLDTVGAIIGIISYQKIYKKLKYKYCEK